MQSALKYRHVFGQVSKTKYENIVRTPAQSEASGVKANNEVLGLSTKSGGGGILTILANDGQRKVEADLKTITGHQGAVLDFEFYPFEAGYVATASEDTHVRLFQFPKDGNLTENITTPVVDLQGHGKKVSLLSWNKTSAYTLASGSYDRTVKVWNVQNSAQVLSYDLSEAITSLDWNSNGSLLGATTKDKQLFIIDPRANQAAMQTECHQGTKSTKFIWLGDTGLGLTTGFANNQERQYKIWDIRNTKEATECVKVDNTSGVLFPHYDQDVGMLYLAGKGDGNIRYYEFVDGQKFTYLSQFQSTTSGSLYGFYPKKCVNTNICELQRVMKVSDKNLEFISFIAPRKNAGDVFQADLYPDCLGNQAALTCEDWFAGKNAEPVKISMKDDQPKNTTSSTSGFTNKNQQSSDDNLLEEIAELHKIIEEKDARIKELEKQVGKVDEDQEQEQE